MALSLSFSISAFCQVDFKDIRDRIVKDYRGARDEFAEVPNMSFLLGQSRILVRISYSEAVIKGADEEAIMESEPNWEDGKVAIGMRFLDALNSKIQDEGVIATSKSKGEEMYRLVVVPTYIGKSGDVKAYAVFYDPSGQQVLRLDGLKATRRIQGKLHKPCRGMVSESLG